VVDFLILLLLTAPAFTGVRVGDDAEGPAAGDLGGLVGHFIRLPVAGR